MIVSVAARPLVRAAALVCFAGAALASCAGNGEGLGATGRAIGEMPSPFPSSSPSPPPSLPPGEGAFPQIQDTVFTPTCSTCRAGATAPAGLRLDAGSSHALLVNGASAQVPGVPRVAPGGPQNSHLVLKIESCAGRRAGSYCCFKPGIDLIRSWSSRLRMWSLGLACGMPVHAACVGHGGLAEPVSKRGCEAPAARLIHEGLVEMHPAFRRASQPLFETASARDEAVPCMPCGA